MLVAGVQHEIVWEDPAANHARLIPLIDRAAEAGARLVVLTEMYSYGFSMNTAVIAEPLDGPSTAFLVRQADRTQAWLAGSVPATPPGADRPHNQLVVAGPDGTVHRYAKVHPFTYADEHRHYEPGDRAVTVPIDDLRVSLTICYDLRFADQYWAAAADTDLYLVVANWPAPRRRHWQTLLAARAIENQAYVLGVNRVGEGDGLTYTGDSVLHDPLGEVVARAAEDTEEVFCGEVDPAMVADVRARLPFLADR